jgi:hypothetical protein
MNIFRKRFFAKHAKSSAAVVSLAIHAVFIVVALSFVAVSVIQKDEQSFEAKPITRPKMQLKKLQVPVTVKKKRPKPKLRKRIVSKPRPQSMPDIRMPEITGIKGGLGAGVGGGLGDAGGVGFSMPEIKVFGIKGKGEKVFIALDSDAYIMRDEVGGMRAYNIIKEELYGIIDGLPSTALFNVAVFEHREARVLFPAMVSANTGNLARLKAWLDPLNEVKQGMGEKDYGVKTLAADGTRIEHARYNGKYGKVEDGRHWYLPAALAMEQQADTVFLLTGWWGVQDHDTKEKAPGWTESEIKRWNEKLAKARVLHKKENEERLARGDPPRVLRDNNQLVNAYFPGSGYFPRQFKQYQYTGRDFAEAVQLCRSEYAPTLPGRSGLSKKKDRYSVNVVYFARQDTGISSHEEARFKEFVSPCNGKLRVLNGLEAIESSIAPSE